MSKKQTTVPAKKAPPANKNALVKAKGTALTEVEEFDTGGNIPAGLENVTSADLIIPRLTILQDLSPETKKKKPEYIEGAMPGLFFDKGTKKVFKELILLPVFYAKIYLEWAPRGSGTKGPVFNYGIDGSIMRKTKIVEDSNGSKKPMLDNGNYIAETATFFLLNLSEKNRASFLPMTSTQLTRAKEWMMQITAEEIERNDGSKFTPPIWYRSWIAFAIEDTNAKGDYFSWGFKPGKTVLEIDPTKQLLEKAKDFYAQARMGNVRGDLEIEEDVNTGNAGDGGARM